MVQWSYRWSCNCSLEGHICSVLFNFDMQDMTQFICHDAIFPYGYVRHYTSGKPSLHLHKQIDILDFRDTRKSTKHKFKFNKCMPSPFYFQHFLVCKKAASTLVVCKYFVPLLNLLGFALIYLAFLKQTQDNRQAFCLVKLLMVKWEPVQVLHGITQEEDSNLQKQKLIG